MNLNNKISHYAWLVLTASGLFLLYKYIIQISPSVITHELMLYFHINATELGNLTATFSYSYLVAQLLVGPLIDKYGTRVCTSSAILLCAIGLLLFSLSSQLWQAEMARALMGAGAAFATISYLKVVALWFPPERFALIGGLLTVAVMVGALSGQAPLAYTISLIGWRHSLMLCALLGMFIALAYFILTAGEKHKPHKANSEQVSLIRLLTLLKNKNNWYLTFYSGLAFSPLIVFGGLWGDPFMQQSYGFDRTTAASYVSLLFVGFAIGGPLFGYLSDRYQSRSFMMMLGTAVTFISCCLVIYVPTTNHYLLASELLFFGIGTGAIMLGFTMGKDLNSLLLAASVVALINTGDALFGALTEPMIGKILDLSWRGKISDGVHYYSVTDYRIALSVLPIYCILSLIFIYGLSKVERKTQSS